MDYGYLSLEAFLRAHEDLINVQSCGNTIHKDILDANLQMENVIEMKM